MDNVMREIENRRKEIDRLGELIVLAEYLEGITCHIFSIGCGKINIEVRSLDALHEVRQFLRRVMGKWEDRRGMTWYAGNDMNTSYDGRYAPISIRLATKPDEFPKELQSDKCKVVERINNEKTYAYVCEQEASHAS